MRKAALLARRELSDQFSDRSAVVRIAVLVALPFALVFLARRQVGGAPADMLVLVFAVQSALLPTASTVTAAASSFAQERSEHTLLPLLAAPIRDIDIVVGKLAAAAIPGIGFSWAALIVYAFIAPLAFGADAVGRVLTLPTVIALAVLSVFAVLTIAAWAMVISCRATSARAAQQWAGVMVAALVVGLAATIESMARSLEGNLLILGAVAVLASDVVALDAIRRLWHREEAIARV